MDATERADGFLQIWLNAGVPTAEKDFVEFCVKDPKCDLSFKGVDRSVIPALADSLLREGFGLQQFLRAGKTMKKLPIHALGDASGPAIMSYGRALQKFGVPDGPGNDTWRQKSEPDAESSIENSIAQISIAEGAAPASMPEARTEEELRQQRGWCPPTAPLLSSDEQWALFDSSKYLGYTAILARQYYKLVVEKQAKEAQKSKKGKEIVKDEQFDENSTTDPVVPNAALNSEEWPPVDQLDFEGFTSWISRCKEAVPSFPKTILRPWKADRDARQKSLVDKLKRWEPSSDFDYGSSKHPDPKHYYKGPPLSEKDLKTLGIKTTMTTPKR